MTSRNRLKETVKGMIDQEALGDARANGLNLSEILEEALHERRGEYWKTENAEAIKANNARVERESLWSETMRVW